MTPNKFFKVLLASLVNCFRAKNLLWHFLMIALTFVLVASGFDWWWFTATRAGVAQALLFPAVVVGGIVPQLLPIVIYLVGYLSKNLGTKTTAALIFLSEILAALLSGSYKALTGRIQPPLRAVGELIDNSAGFRFGFWRGGVFWGWPSTHTTLAFAAAMVIYQLYPKNKPLGAACIFYAFYIGVGISTNIHWFSDFVAGAILGSLIGLTVFKTYQKVKIFV